MFEVTNSDSSHNETSKGGDRGTGINLQAYYIEPIFQKEERSEHKQIQKKLYHARTGFSLDNSLLF